MEYQTKLLDEEENAKELEEENDEPWDLADRLYEEWCEKHIMAEELKVWGFEKMVKRKVPRDE